MALLKIIAEDQNSEINASKNLPYADAIKMANRFILRYRTLIKKITIDGKQFYPKR